jgi:hypothetical protein
MMVDHVAGIPDLARKDHLALGYLALHRRRRTVPARSPGCGKSTLLYIVGSFVNPTRRGEAGQGDHRAG